MDKLHWKSATEIARLIRGKKVTASDVLEHFLTRVDRFNPKLNAIIWQDRERARNVPKQLTRRWPRASCGGRYTACR